MLYFLPIVQKADELADKAILLVDDASSQLVFVDEARSKLVFFESKPSERVSEQLLLCALQ